MEQTGKELRIILQKKLNEIRQNKGIKIADIKLTDENGKTLSEGQKSMLFSGKRQIGLWPIMQIATALNQSIAFTPKYINVTDYKLVEQYWKVDKMTSEEFGSIQTDEESIGPYTIRRFQPKGTHK